MIFGYKTKNDGKIEELEKVIKKYVEKTDLLQGEVNTLKKERITASQKHNVLSSQFEDEVKYTKERFIEYIDERTVLYTGLHDRLEKIESIGDIEMLVKRLTRVEEQFGPILGKVTDTFSGAMQSLISEAGKTNQYIAGMAKDVLEKAPKDEPNWCVLGKINGKETPLAVSGVSYDEICDLSGYDDPDSLPTVTFLNADGGGESELVSGRSIIPKNGIIINVHDTSNA